MINFIGQWNVVPPAGLTDTGRIHQFQNRTVQRLGDMGESIASDVFTQLLQAVEAAYQEGSGAVAQSLQYRVERTRDGVSVEFSAGTNHLVYLTALAGQPFSPQGHIISANSAKKLRFYWKNPIGGGAPGVYAFRQVHWRTRVGADVMTDVLSAGAQAFQRAMIGAHDAALVDFVQNELQLNTRSTRVGVTSPQ